MSELICHICGNVADFHCQQCDEPVCEDCCVPFTLQNLIDYTLCNCCHDGNEAEEYLQRRKEDEIQDEMDKKKEERRKARFARYWKTENITKRREQRVARKKAQAELQRKQTEESVKVVNEMFSGMF